VIAGVKDDFQAEYFERIRARGAFIAHRLG
jgi:hypothetical protein